MSVLDILLMAMVGGSVAAGFFAGFSRAAIGLVAVIGGIVFGLWFYGIPAAWARQALRSEAAANVLGFLAVFLAFQVAGAVLGKILAKLFKWTGLTFLDRLTGAAFGLVRGALVAVALVAVLMAFAGRPVPGWMAGSRLLPYAIDAADVCAAIAPKALKDAFGETMAAVREGWKERVRDAQKQREREGEPKSAPKPRDQ
jgi:membrane protein required for colicin V production